MQKSTIITKVMITLFTVLWLTMMVLIMIREITGIKNLGLLIAIIIVAFLNLVFLVVSISLIVNDYK
ncbi:MAG: hypothetical protein RR334_02590, partial [Clostridia bacterium]